MNNRLDELVPSWAREQEADLSGGSPMEIDVDLEEGTRSTSATATNSQAAEFMATFFQDVDEIKSAIATIKSATMRISDLNDEAVMATTTEKETEISSILSPLVLQSNKKAKQAKVLLGAVKAENEKLKAGKKIKPSELRIRENLCNTLTRKFISEMKSYQHAQQKYKKDIKQKVKRQVQIVKPEATDEEIDSVMRSEGGRDQLYKDKILKGVADPIKNIYNNVADKYQDVLTLEASVAELHQMFLDFALLTEQQGEMLDQIEYQVKSAGDYIDDGNVDIQSAIQYQKSIRKKQCCIIVIVLIILICILLFTGVLT